LPAAVVQEIPVKGNPTYIITTYCYIQRVPK